MPNVPHARMGVWENVVVLCDGIASYQLVGGVVAYQGFDG